MKLAKALKLLQPSCKVSIFTAKETVAICSSMFKCSEDGARHCSQGI
ncbi:MAG: hypothetical protein ACE5PM_00165 [Candidatus Hydrothermarchaeales archaeon]